MKKNILILIISFLIIIGFVYLIAKTINLSQEDSTAATEKDLESKLANPEEEVVEPADDFIQCLVDQGMVVYASKTCPACTSFVQELGGYEKVDSLFVFCSEESDRCRNEMKSRYVPEIQIKGEVYTGNRKTESLASITGCEK